jgi:hypothetical protein
MRIFYWTFPVSIVVATFLIPLEINSVEELISWFYIGVLGHISMLPFVIYGQNKDRLKEQIPLLLMMGLVRGGVIGLLVPLFGVIDPLPVQMRALNSMVSVFYWFQVAAVIYEFQFAFRKRVRRLVEESILKDARIEASPSDVTSHELILLISELQKRIVSTLAGSPTQEKLISRAKEIDQLVKDHIRPLSKSQWRDGQLIWVKAGALKVIKGTLSVAPLHIWAVAILALPYSLTGAFNRYGIINTLITQVSWFILAWIVSSASRRIFPAHNRNYLKQNLAIVMSVFFVITPCIFYIHTFWPGGIFTIQNQISAHIFSALTVTALLLASSLVIALHEDQAHIFETLSNVLKEKNLQMLIDSGIQTGTESAYGQYLHAEVQSQLLACKLLLLKAAESDFTLFAPEITQQIVDRLEKIKQPYERPAARIPTERVRELATSWRGLAEISYELSPELSEVHSYSDVVAQLIEESVINAIRHGKAKKINVRSFSTDGLINVVITDNGHLKEGETGSGLGTILFNTFAKSWRIARENDTTVVTFSVSTENPVESRKG